MSNREAFEKLCNSLEWDITHTIKSSRIRDLMWVTWCNATEHAQQWTPYKEGNDVKNGWYLVTHSNGSRDFTEHDSGDWLCLDEVIAYCAVPPPFVPEVSND